MSRRFVWGSCVLQERLRQTAAAALLWSIFGNHLRHCQAL